MKYIFKLSIMSALLFTCVNTYAASPLNDEASPPQCPSTCSDLSGWTHTQILKVSASIPDSYYSLNEEERKNLYTLITKALKDHNPKYIWYMIAILKNPSLADRLSSAEAAMLGLNPPPHMPDLLPAIRFNLYLFLKHAPTPLENEVERKPLKSDKRVHFADTFLEDSQL